MELVWNSISPFFLSSPPTTSSAVSTYPVVVTITPDADSRNQQYPDLVIQDSIPWVDCEIMLGLLMTTRLLCWRLPKHLHRQEVGPDSLRTSSSDSNFGHGWRSNRQLWVSECSVLSLPLDNHLLTTSHLPFIPKESSLSTLTCHLLTLLTTPAPGLMEMQNISLGWVVEINKKVLSNRIQVHKLTSHHSLRALKAVTI